MSFLLCLRLSVRSTRTFGESGLETIQHPLVPKTFPSTPSTLKTRALTTCPFRSMLLAEAVGTSQREPTVFTIREI